MTCDPRHEADDGEPVRETEREPVLSPAVGGLLTLAVMLLVVLIGVAHAAAGCVR